MTLLQRLEQIWCRVIIKRKSNPLVVIPVRDRVMIAAVFHVIACQNQVVLSAATPAPERTAAHVTVPTPSMGPE